MMRGAARWAAITMAAYAAMAVLWRSAFSQYFIYFDEWAYFVAFAKARGLGGMLRVLAEPALNHVIPIFKLLLLAEYSSFGMHAAPYFAVSVGLFALTAVVLYAFLREELGGGPAGAFFVASLYAINSAYYSVVSWVAAQSLTLAALFLFGALACAARGARSGRTAPMWWAAVLCFLSSLSMTMGAVSWAFTAAYFTLKRFSLIKPFLLGRDFRPVFLGMLPLGLSGALTAVLYRIVGAGAASRIESMMTTDPLIIAQGSAIVLGDVVLSSVGYFELTRLAGVGDGGQAAPYTALVVVAALAAALLPRVAREHRPLVIAGALVAISSAAVLVIVTGRYEEHDLFGLTKYSRYKYFPAIGLVLMLAPYVSAAFSAWGRRAAAAFAVLLIAGAPLHSSIFTRTVEADPFRTAFMRKVMGAVEAAVRYPLAREPERFLRSLYAEQKGVHTIAVVVPPDALDPLAIDSTVQTSRIYEDIPIMGGMFRFIDLMYLYKEKDDVIVEGKGRATLLRAFDPVAPGGVRVQGNASISVGEEDLRVLANGGQGGAALLIPGGRADAPLQHLVFEIASDAASELGFSYSTPDGPRPERRVRIAPRRLGMGMEEIVIPCPLGVDLRLELPAGRYEIKRIRIYR